MTPTIKACQQNSAPAVFPDKASVDEEITKANSELIKVTKD
jgi:hypothetical protein